MTHEVKKRAANSLGIYDMSGNVWECCWDWFGTITGGTAATGASSGSECVLRGGSWNHYDYFSAVSYRNKNNPFMQNLNYSIRIVRTAQ
ncbi:MAG: formylglycine-generating enzyme family protein [Treponemataceae bacterium]|nr:formylglycine-generating enzyme family protein [Treponemataceae bacterium]